MVGGIALWSLLEFCLINSVTNSEVIKNSIFLWTCRENNVSCVFQLGYSKWYHWEFPSHAPQVKRLEVIKTILNYKTGWKLIAKKNSLLLFWEAVEGSGPDRKIHPAEGLDWGCVGCCSVCCHSCFPSWHSLGGYTSLRTHFLYWRFSIWGFCLQNYSQSLNEYITTSPICCSTCLAGRVEC